jgi:hypothetical protein
LRVVHGSLARGDRPSAEAGSWGPRACLGTLRARGLRLEPQGPRRFDELGGLCPQDAGPGPETSSFATDGNEGRTNHDRDTSPMRAEHVARAARGADTAASPCPPRPSRACPEMSKATPAPRPCPALFQDSCPQGQAGADGDLATVAPWSVRACWTLRPPAPSGARGRAAGKRPTGRGGGRGRSVDRDVGHDPPGVRSSWWPLTVTRMPGARTTSTTPRATQTVHPPTASPRPTGSHDDYAHHAGGWPPRAQRPPGDLSNHPGPAARLAPPDPPVDRLRQRGASGLESVGVALGDLRLQGCDEDCAKRVGAKEFRDDGQPPVAGTLHHGGLTQPRAPSSTKTGGRGPGPRPPARPHATIRNRISRPLCNPASLQVVEGKGFVGDPHRIPSHFADTARQIVADRGVTRNLRATASPPLATPLCRVVLHSDQSPKRL